MAPNSLEPKTHMEAQSDLSASSNLFPIQTLPVEPPVFDPQNNLHEPIDVNINSIVEQLWDNRTRSPIIPRADTRDLEKITESLSPKGSTALDTVVEDTVSILMKHSRHIAHPGHFGLLAPQGLRTDPMSFAMTAATNQNVAMHTSSPVGATMERTVVSWLCDLVGYDKETGPSGKLLSGGSISNLTAMATAMTHHFGPDYRNKGIAHYVTEGGKMPVFICSVAAHFCFQRAAGMLGLGVENLITIPADDNFSMRLDLLEEAVEKYADRGIIGIGATAGTTLTGGIDNLMKISEICESRNIWFHVDGAYGGSALMSPELAPLLKGIEKADSVTMDLHKWFYMSLDCSAILYKNPKTVRSLFTDTSASMKDLSLDTWSQSNLFFLMGPELSRRNRALPLYIAFRHYGIDKLGKNVHFNVLCARYLSARVSQDSSLELVWESDLSISIFRMLLPSGYKHRQDTNEDGTPITDETVVDDMNKYIRVTIENEDQFWMSGANIGGRPVLRCCLVNYNTRPHHLDELLGHIKRVGNNWIRSNNVNVLK